MSRACLLGAIAMVTALSARAVGVATAPAGFVRTTVAAAISQGQHATSLIATPLLNAPVTVGRVAAAHGARVDPEITRPSVPFSRPSAIDRSRPHMLFITSGAFAGFTFRVLSNDATSVMVDARGFDLAKILAPGDGFEVRPLHTFRSLFGSDAASVTFTAAADAARADQLLVNREGTWNAYWFTGSTWRRAGSAVDAGDDVILPQDGIVVYRRATRALDVRFVGDAPATDAVLSVPAGAVSIVANPFPTDVGIGEFGFDTVSGWRCGAQPGEADHIQVCSGNAWRTYWHDGTSWNSSTGSTADATIAAGTAMIVVRKTADSFNPFAIVARPYDL